MKPAERILLRLLREPPRLPGSPLSRRRLRELLHVASIHGVLPIVVDRLTTDDAGRFVAADAEKLLHKGIADVSVVTGRCMMLSAELDRALDTLAEKGISAVCVKGPDFARRLYERVQLRPFRDIDVLVSPSAFGPACKALTSAGYRGGESGMKYSGGYGQRSFIGKGGCVEIHWNLVNSPTLRRAVSVELEDLQLQADGRLSPAACLLLACVHAAAGHQFDRLQALCDIARLSAGRAGPIDTDYLLDAVDRTGAATATATALRLTSAALGKAGCDDLRRRLRLREPPTARALIRTATVLRARGRWGSLRRQLYREILKRPSRRSARRQDRRREQTCEAC